MRGLNPVVLYCVADRSRLLCRAGRRHCVTRPSAVRRLGPAAACWKSSSAPTKRQVSFLRKRDWARVSSNTARSTWPRGSQREVPDRCQQARVRYLPCCRHTCTWSALRALPNPWTPPVPTLTFHWSPSVARAVLPGQDDPQRGGTGSAWDPAGSRRTCGWPGCATRAARRACLTRCATRTCRRRWASSASAGRGRVRPLSAFPGRRGFDALHAGRSLSSHLSN